MGVSNDKLNWEILLQREAKKLSNRKSRAKESFLLFCYCTKKQQFFNLDLHRDLSSFITYFSRYVVALMYFSVTYMAFILTSFMHEMVNNCKHKERRKIYYLCSQKTQPRLNSPLGNIGHWSLFLHLEDWLSKKVVM